MPGEIDKEYENLVASREPWLQDAEDSSLLTIPQLRVRGYETNSGLYRRRTTGNHGNTKPYTSIGRDGVNTLANTLLTLLFPLDIRWFRLTLQDEQIRDYIDRGIIENEADVDEAMKKIEDRMLYEMEQHSLHSLLHGLFRRNLVEGNDLIHLYKKPNGDYALRIVPLRDMVIQRFNGEVTRILIKEQVAKNKSGKAETVDLYTEVNYLSKEVYQLETGGQRKNAKKVNEPVSRYILVSPSRETLDDYADGYVHELKGDIEYHNDLTRDIKRAISIFSKIITVNDSDVSGIDTYDLARMEGGDIVDGTVKSDGSLSGVGYISAGTMPNQIAFVAQMIQEIEQRINRQFGGLLSTVSETFTQPRSALEIARIASELDTFAAGLGQVYNANLQRPLAQMYLDLVQEKKAQELEDQKKKAQEQQAQEQIAQEQKVQNKQVKDKKGGIEEMQINPTIVAGNGQLSRLQELSKFLQAISTQLQMNPEFTNQIKWREVWNRMTNGLAIDTDGLLKTEEELQQEQAQLAQQQGNLNQIRDQQLAALRQQRISDNNDGLVA